MKTRKLIRATFLGTEVSVTLPQSWRELTESDLCRLYKEMAAHPHQDVRLTGLCVLADMSFDCTRRDGDKIFVMIPARSEDGKVFRTVHYLEPEVIGAIMTELDWMLEPGAEPVRLSLMGDHHAVDARLHNLPFGAYLMVENLYQGFVQSGNTEALARIAKILYPGYDGKKFKQTDVINILNWTIQVKNLFSAMFPNFFKPVTDDGGESSMEEICNYQIRALTGGDITKEEQIKGIDCWRALTELDFKAKEAEELRREQTKIKNR